MNYPNFGSLKHKSIIVTVLVSGILLALASCKQDSSSGPTTTTTSTPTASPSPFPPLGPLQISSRGYNLQRSNINTQETVLTPANVGPTSFAKIAQFSTNGAYVYAQPLYSQGVTIQTPKINNQRFNVLYVATEDDTLYAFDADAGSAGHSNMSPLWSTSFQIGNRVHRIGGYNHDNNCPELGPMVGITGTPVIDTVNQWIFLVAATKVATTSTVTYYQTLFKVSLNTGAILGQIDIDPQNTLDKNGTPLYNAQTSNQRPGLALNNGKVYIGFSSHCDLGPYVGLVLSYDENLNFLSYAQSTQMPVAGSPGANPQGGQGGIWMGGMAPAIDTTGNLYVATGNGNWDGKSSFGCSILKMSDNNSSNKLQITDYFSPFDEQALNNDQIDLDLGSGGVMLLPDSMPGPVPNLLVAAGKTGQVYVLNRGNGPKDTLGKFNSTLLPTLNNGPYSPNAVESPQFFTFQPSYFSNVVQSWNLSGQPYGMNGYNSSDPTGPNAPPLPNPNNPPAPSVFSTFAFFNNRLYTGAAYDAIRAFPFDSSTGQFTTSGSDVDVSNYNQLGWPGATPVISSNGTGNGILWYVDAGRANNNNGTSMEGILLAYNADNLSGNSGEPNSGLLYNSDLTGSPNDKVGPAVKYTPPTVANGHVYVATKTSVQVYGPTGKAKTPFAAQTLPTSTTSGAAITMSYNTNPTWPSNVTACPVFSPASSYNFVIQPCTLESQSGNVGKSSGAFPICESAASLSGGTVTGLTTGVSLIIGQSQQINLPAGTYEILPSGNNIPSNGGAEAVLGSAQLFVNPATFTVQANQYTPVPTSFFCGISNGTATTPVPSSGSN